MDNPKKIVILGAGFAGTYTYKHLHKFFHKDPTVQLILVNKNNYFLFTPLLHEVATGGINPEHVVEPLRKVLGCCLSRFYQAEVKSIKTKEQQIETSLGNISYDYLVVALGSEPNFFDIEGAEENTFTLKTLPDATKLKNHLIETLEHASKTDDKQMQKELLSYAIVGGGPTGVELAAEMIEFIKGTYSKYYSNSNLIDDISISLIQRGDELLPTFPEKLRLSSKETLEKKGVSVLTNETVVKITDNSAELASGKTINTHTTVWTAGVKPKSMKFDIEVETDQNGRIVVQPTLELKEAKNIYVLGDQASFIEENSDKPLPGTAQVATDQASTAAKNIHADINNQAKVHFKYKHSGDLISLGRWMALAEIHSFSLAGYVVWWMYRTVYLYKLLSWQKKFKVAFDWTLNLFSSRDISEI